MAHTVSPPPLLVARPLRKDFFLPKGGLLFSFCLFMYSPVFMINFELGIWIKIFGQFRHVTKKRKLSMFQLSYGGPFTFLSSNHKGCETLHDGLWDDELHPGPAWLSLSLSLCLSLSFSVSVFVSVSVSIFPLSPPVQVGLISHPQ